MLIIDGNAVYEIDCECMKQKNIDIKKIFGEKLREDGPLLSDQTADTQAVYQNQYTGSGVGVAILDTGIYPHGDFGGRIKGFCDILDGRKEPWDPNGHGTHVAGNTKRAVVEKMIVW